MSERPKKSRKGDARHIRLYAYMTRSPAWKSLNGNERATYLLLAERYVGVNNGKIPLSIREVASELGIHFTTAARCLAALQDGGFIVARVKGAFSLKRRHATQWRLTEHTCNVSGHGPSGEYRAWRPGPEIQNTVALALPIGCPSATDVAKMSRNGCPSATVDGQKFISRLPWCNTLSYQVPPSKETPAEPPDPMAEYAGTGTRRYTLSTDPRAYA
jgi:hypothetical protein